MMIRKRKLIYLTPVALVAVLLIVQVDAAMRHEAMRVLGVKVLNEGTVESVQTSPEGSQALTWWESPTPDPRIQPFYKKPGGDARDAM